MTTSSVLFYLLPLNAAAKEVVKDPVNRHLWALDEGGKESLAVGQFDTLCPDHGTIATLGRNGDIKVSGEVISRLHCSFELHPESHVVMVVDRSVSQTTKLVGEVGSDEVYSFEPGRPRKIALNRAVMTSIGLGGFHKELVQFKIEWARNAEAVLEKRKEAFLRQNPRFPQTPDIVPETTVAQTQPSSIRFQKFQPALGRGTFGEVYRALNVDNGQFVAVKTIKQAAAFADRRAWLYLGREIQALGALQHERIVQFLGSQNWESEEALIFMALMDGTLTKLTSNRPGALCSGIATTALTHMLEALDYLDANNFVHRDLKPDNILYKRVGEDEYHFRLGDLGFCNSANVATSSVGTPMYQAPEIDTGERQTSKVDVWSLYVTMLWTMDIGGFRGISNVHGMGRHKIQNAVLSIAARETSVSLIEEMGRRNPEKRASAAQILVKCFGGVGLTTERHSIPPIPADDKTTTASASKHSPANDTEAIAFNAVNQLDTYDVVSPVEKPQMGSTRRPGLPGPVDKLAAEQAGQQAGQQAHHRTHHLPDEMSF